MKKYTVVAGAQGTGKTILVMKLTKSYFPESVIHFTRAADFLDNIPAEHTIIGMDTKLIVIHECSIRQIEKITGMSEPIPTKGSSSFKTEFILVTQEVPTYLAWAKLEEKCMLIWIGKK